MTSDRPVVPPEKDGRNSSPLIRGVVQTIADKGAIDLLVDAAELALDQELEEGLIREIPVVGTLVKLAKVGLSIRDRLFLKKLARFLKELQTVSDSDRAKFETRIKTEPQFLQDVGESLIMLLDRADALGKPELVGKAFAAYLGESVDYEQFSRMATGIDRALMADLKRLAQFEGTRIEESWGANLVNAGLTTMSLVLPMGGGFIEYPLTEAGHLVRKVCFGRG